MQPRLGGGVAAPGGPAPVGALESVVRAILRRGAIAEDADQGADDPAVGPSVEAAEVGLRTGLVLVER
jgi:hypothetical protein